VEDGLLLGRQEGDSPVRMRRAARRRTTTASDARAKRDPTPVVRTSPRAKRSSRRASTLTRCRADSSDDSNDAQSSSSHELLGVVNKNNPSDDDSNVMAAADSAGSGGEDGAMKKSSIQQQEKQQTSVPLLASVFLHDMLVFPCDHCGREFTAKNGLTYHLQNFVCRPEFRPDGPKQKGKRKVVDGAVESKYKRFRGAVDDRTCPTCHRVFTSAIGCNYHTGAFFSLLYRFGCENARTYTHTHLLLD
jgi:hypothetical protein